MATGDAAAVDPSVVQARVMRLGRAMYARITAMTTRMVIGFALSAGVGAAVGLGTGQPFVAGVFGLGLSLLAAAVAWAPFADRTFREAVELVFDHTCHERAEWKAETGTPMPSNLKAAERWLVAHPTGLGRASMLLFTGRLDEADRAIEAIEPKTPEEAFEVDLLRQQRVMYAGGRPDVASLLASLPSLPSPRERRHRRECVALLEAELAVNLGHDPLAVLAAAREEVGEVYWSMRAPWLLAKWYSIGLLVIATATLAGVWLAGLAGRG